MPSNKQARNFTLSGISSFLFTFVANYFIIDTMTEREKVLSEIDINNEAISTTARKLRRLYDLDKDLHTKLFELTKAERQRNEQK